MNELTKILFEQAFPLAQLADARMTIYVKKTTITVGVRVGNHYLCSTINAEHKVTIFKSYQDLLNVHIGNGCFSVAESQLEALLDFFKRSGVPCQRLFFGAHA